MRKSSKHKPKESSSKIAHHRQVHKPLDKFFEENEIEKREQYRKEHEQYEQEIFEHIKEHTKKMLRQRRG